MLLYFRTIGHREKVSKNIGQEVSTAPGAYALALFVWYTVVRTNCEIKYKVSGVMKKSKVSCRKLFFELTVAVRYYDWFMVVKLGQRRRHGRGPMWAVWCRYTTHHDER